VKKLRRKLQRIAKRRIVFIDQSNIELGAKRTRALCVEGQEAKVAVSQGQWYPKRVDMMAAISYDDVLGIETSGPTKRRREKRKGYRKIDVLNFIRLRLAKKLPKLRVPNMTFCMDKALKISQEEVLDALKDGGCTVVEHVVVLPTASGKHLSPLDNCLWHQVKHRIREAQPHTEHATEQAIKAAFKAITAEQIHAYYRHCSLTRGQNVNKDLE